MPFAQAMSLPRMAHRTTPVVQGLEVSQGDLLQHQLFQAQLREQTLQLCVLSLKLLDSPYMFLLSELVAAGKK